MDISEKERKNTDEIKLQTDFLFILAIMSICKQIKNIGYFSTNLSIVNSRLEYLKS